MTQRSLDHSLPVRFLLRVATSTRDYFVLLIRVLRGTFSRPFYVHDTVQQMDAVGVQSLGIVILTGLFTGMVLALQSLVEMERFGATIYIGRLVGASAIRELGPVLTALMVTGRAGSGMAAELGAMRITEQTDALSAMGVDPVRRLVVPRVVASIAVLPLLTVITDLVAIFGGLLITLVKTSVTTQLYLSSVWQTLAETGFVLRIVPIDVVAGTVKPLVFGAVMALTSCHFGIRASGGTAGVGDAATRAVVVSSVLILASDYFVTQLIIGLLIQ